VRHGVVVQSFEDLGRDSAWLGGRPGRAAKLPVCLARASAMTVCSIGSAIARTASSAPMIRNASSPFGATPSAPSGGSRLASPHSTVPPTRGGRSSRCSNELLPLDDERRAENEVWLAFTARALVAPELRAQHDDVHDALHQACVTALDTLATVGHANTRTATAVQAERLHALLDALAVHTALRPGQMRPEHIVAVMGVHLDALENERGSAEATASV